MTTRDFIKDFKMENGLDGVRHIINKTYMSIGDKANSAYKIVKATTYDNDMNFSVNSVSKYLLTNLEIINNYTDIDIDFSNPVDEFDTLKSCGALDTIISALPEQELMAYDMIVEMTYDDEVNNKFEIHRFIDEKFETIKEALLPFAEVFAENFATLLMGEEESQEDNNDEQ